MQHLIQKQVIELRLDKKIDAFRVQHLVSQRYWKEIKGELEKAFDVFSVEDEVIHVDKLEIELGVIHLDSFEQKNWGQNLHLKVIEQLKEVTKFPISEKYVLREAKALNVCSQWLFYMQHGYLPWNTFTVHEEWYNNVLEGLATDFKRVSELRSIILQDPVAVKRIVVQHSEEFTLKLLEILTAKKLNDLPQAIDEIHLVMDFLSRQTEKIFIQNKKNFKRELWEHVLRFAISEEKGVSSEKLAEKAISRFATDVNLIQTIIRDLSPPLKLTLPIFIKIAQSQTLPEQGLSKKNEASQAKSKEKTSGKIQTKNTTEKHIDEGLFVQEAGIVLLHPFLHSFFRRLDVISEGNFINDLLHQKALYLLHYLATGNTTAQEYELTMAKILCGYPFEETVDINLLISENELSEAEDLPVAAIQQWEILKDTSATGFREGFLQRNGKLLTKQGQLYLQVETSPIDMLLDHLPWNLSMIKLPWMEGLLRVEWR